MPKLRGGSISPLEKHAHCGFDDAQASHSWQPHRGLAFLSASQNYIQKKPTSSRAATGGRGASAPALDARTGHVDPARLVFIDETAANTKMVRLYGRCPRGERLIDRVP